MGSTVMGPEDSVAIRQRERDGVAERVTVRKVTAGWAVVRERGERLVSNVTYDDWHRVERVLQLFDLTTQSAA